MLLRLLDSKHLRNAAAAGAPRGKLALFIYNGKKKNREGRRMKGDETQRSGETKGRKEKGREGKDEFVPSATKS